MEFTFFFMYPEPPRSILLITISSESNILFLRRHARFLFPGGLKSDSYLLVIHVVSHFGVDFHFNYLIDTRAVARVYLDLGAFQVRRFEEKVRAVSGLEALDHYFEVRSEFFENTLAELMAELQEFH